MITKFNSPDVLNLPASFVPEWTVCTRPGKEENDVCIRGRWKHQFKIKSNYKPSRRIKRDWFMDIFYAFTCFVFDLFCPSGPPPNNPPNITCPTTDINEYYTNKGETTVNVSWPSPMASDKEDGELISYQQTQGNRNGTQHEEGGHLVTYMATDRNNAMATCSFTFNVKVHRCPIDYISLLHGKVECSLEENKNMYGSICAYFCDEGYELAGSKISECLENETWSTDKPVCQAISCGPPPKVQRGSFSCEDPSFYFRTVCAITCDLGYETDKIDSIRCQSNKDWTVPGICKDVSPPTIDCTPDVETFSGPKLGDVIVTWNPPVTQDNSGYPVNVTSNFKSGSTFAVGTTSVIFTAADASNNIAICRKLVHIRVQRCPEYVATNNSDVSCSHGNAYGSVCTTTCQQAYELTNLEASSQMCLEDQTWDGETPTCLPRTCTSPPVIANGNFSCPSGMRYQDVCTISCNQGFTAQPPLTITCNINIEWSQTGSCLDTQAPTFPDGCPASFEVEAASLGEPTYVNYTLPKATDNSNEPVVLLGNPISGSAFDIGTSTVTVTATDRQGNSANCTFYFNVKYSTCNEPKIDTSGKVLVAYSCPNQYVYGASCLLNCTDGNPIQGPSSIKCDKNSTGLVQWAWPGNVKPYCNTQTCPKLTSPLNGALSCDGFGVGSEMCFIMCNINFTYPASAPDQYTCSKGKWVPYTYIPGCTARRQPSEALTKPSFYYYSADCSANSSQIKDNFLLILNDVGLSDVCGDDGCVVNSVEITCGPITQRRKKKDTQPFLYEIKAVISLGNYKDQTSPDETQIFYQNIVDGVNNQILSASDSGKFNMPNVGTFDSFKSGEMDFRCEPGKQIVYTKMSCAGCGQGYAFNNATGVCDKCPQGTYQDQEISFRCTPCPEGTTTTENMARSLADCQNLCLPGQYSSSGIERCNPCPEGTYTSLYGTKQCTLCPYGMTTASTGASSLQYCFFVNIRLTQSTSKPAIQIFDDMTRAFTFMTWISDATTLQKSFLKFSIKPTPSSSNAALVIDTVVLEIQRSTDVTNRKLIKWNHVALVYTSGNLTLFVNGQRIENVNKVIVTKLAQKDIRFQGSLELKSVIISGIQMTRTAYTESQIKEFSTSCNKQVDNHVLAFKPWESLIMTNSTCNDRDMCINEPCGQNGTCISQSDSYVCICDELWSGDRCQNAPDFCHGNLCANGSTCINQPENNGYECSCQDGFAGVLCNERNHIVNGEWGSWSQWSSCSVTCGSGVKSRLRYCDSPMPENGGDFCKGSQAETEICNTGCEDCKWNEWTQWTCDVTCGSGTATRTRSVASVAVNGGLSCQGPKVNTKLCKLAVCPVDGGFGEWGEWSTCSSSCGGGVSTRQRSCDNPAPSQGGKPCDSTLANEAQSLPELREGQKEWNCSTDNAGLMTCFVVCQDALILMPHFDYNYQCGPTSNYTWSQQSKDNPVGLTQACSDRKIPESVSPVITTTFIVDCNNQPDPEALTASVNQQLSQQECFKAGTCAFTIDTSPACKQGTRAKKSVGSMVMLTRLIFPGYNTSESSYLGGQTEEDVQKQMKQLTALQQMFGNFINNSNNLSVTIDGVKYTGIIQTMHTSVTCHDGSGFVQGFCVDCPAGTYSAQNGSCVYCDKGMYQDKPKQLSCISCPPGTTTSGKGSYSLAHCVTNPITFADVYPFFVEAPINIETTTTVHKSDHTRDNGAKNILLVATVTGTFAFIILLGFVIFFIVRRFRSPLARTTPAEYTELKDANRRFLK
ncbi:sushi, von Willebrand factor type A, EGF and pentraxin domain-containing protein 1-like [Physella acuta]|uniref:sushi, von Willebrand factor type A, EGF and pentraxin domain-containing protein 1-like n=1 Tax=Physella acuta TaxID=109671 RepID=UPI0027DBE9CF|nr:sushi, von Willebrand factor type A, EGF and pentraxin domain-containing protein 1-like [Physella acuta]